MKTKKHRGLWLSFDRALSQNLLKQLTILGVVLVVALGFSYFLLSWSGAEWEQFCKDEKLNKWLLPLYLLIDSNALNNLYMGTDGTHVHGWMLFASSLTFLFGAFIFNGVIIGIITNSIERRVKNHHEGHLHYLQSGHYLIMGYDEMIPSIITHIFDKDKDAYVLLLTSADVVNIHETLQKSFDKEQLKNVIINYGHRTSTESYNDIHLDAAEEIYIVGNRTSPAHDAINVESVDSICSYLEQPQIKDRPQRIVCVFEDLDTYAAFRTSEIFERVKNLHIEFVPYNFYAGWAKQVFVKQFHRDMDRPNQKIYYPAVYGNGITPEDKKYVHLVFIGTTNFAVAFAMEAAHVLHFPNFNRDHKLKTRITFIDKNADIEKEEFITRNRHFFEVQSYKYLDLSDETTNKEQPNTTASYFGRKDGYKEGKDFDFLDLEFEFIKGDIFSMKVQDEICQWAIDKDGQYLSIFLALSNQRENFAFGMNMPDEVYDNEIPVFIRQNRSDNFVSNLRDADKKIKDDTKRNTYSRTINGELYKSTLGGRYSHIYPFGMNETAYSADEHSLKRAKLINYLYCTMTSDNKFQGLITLDSIPKDKIWTEASELWENLSVALKWSNLYNAYTIRTKMMSLRMMRGLSSDDTSKDFSALTDIEVEEMAKVEHNRWNVEKLLMGFRKPHRNEDKYAKENALFKDDLEQNKKRFVHHDIRPFEDLDSIKDLDREFSRYIPWIMKMTE